MAKDFGAVESSGSAHKFCGAGPFVTVNMCELGVRWLWEKKCQSYMSAVHPVLL